MKVRLYHLAHEWEVSSTVMLEALHEAGRKGLKNHFAEVDDDEVADLRDVLANAGLFGTEEPPAVEAEEHDGEGYGEGYAEPAAAEAEPTEAPDAAMAAATSAPESSAPGSPAESAPAPVAAAAAAAPAEPARPQPRAADKKPGRPDAPAGVAEGFRGFAPGFDPSARRPPRRAASPAAPPPLDDRTLGGGGLDALKPDRTKRGSRTAVSPTMRGKQTTRRSGGGGSMGRGRRLERRMQERERWIKSPGKRGKRGGRARSINVVRPDRITIELPISVKDLSAELAIRINEIMGFLMKQGMMLNQNEPVPAEAIEMIGLNWGIDITLEHEAKAEDAIVEMEEEQDEDEALEPRQPVVAVLGHVDHGKTSLLDFIRKSKKPVTAQEAGGITQHIGAYVAEHNDRKLTFIDTPGHAAFTEMRARGANVTDIVLLVVAADDGVMPQTKEAIQHAQAADAHIVVAANKIDKKDANIQKVLQDLSQIEGMLPSEYGGEIEVVPVSAHTGQGIDELLETILTYTDLLELKANPNKRARGTVLEAKKTVGRGTVVTLLVEDGTLKQGDPILAGRHGGKVRRMINDLGATVKAAGPGTPVEVLGFDDVPDAGDRFYVVEKDADLKRILAERDDLARKTAGGFDHIPTDEQGIWRALIEQEVKEVRLVLKTDVQGSLQVLKRELANLSTDEVRCKVIRDGVGGISTADVLLATASDAVVIGFGVTADAQARTLAREKNVEIRTYRIIYELLDGMREIMGGVLEPEEVEEVIGQVQVRKVFRSSKLGNIAGCFVESGVVRRNALLRLVRDGIILWQGPMDSLRRFKDDVKEVRENFECGIKLHGYDDLKDGDMLEVIEVKKIPRTL